MTAQKSPTQHRDALINDLRSLIEETRSTIATTVNAALTRLYWRVGKRINVEVLQRERATYGAEILPTLSAKLVPLYGDGFSARNLARMVRFAALFRDEGSVSILWRQSGIRVTEYLTELLPRNILEQELHKAITQARQWMSLRLDAGKEMES